MLGQAKRRHKINRARHVTYPCGSRQGKAERLSMRRMVARVERGRPMLRGSKCCSLDVIDMNNGDARQHDLHSVSSQECGKDTSNPHA